MINWFVLREGLMPTYRRVLALLFVIAVASPARAATTPPDGYLVLPFENRSSVKSLDCLRSSLATTLAEKLEAHPALRPVYGPLILEGLSPDAVRVASRAADAGARWVFAGSFARPNWRAEVTVRLYEVIASSPAELRPVGEVTQQGERSALFDVLDRAFLQLLGENGLVPEADKLAPLRRVPTKDLYAFTLYGRALNRVYGMGVPVDTKMAQKLLERVLFIDPKFAEARRALAVLLIAGGEMGRAAGNYAYALELKPGYYAAMVGLVQLYRIGGKRQAAQELAARALELRPYDQDMRFLLGQLEFEAGDLDGALANLRRVTADSPHHLGAHRTLVLVYAGKGDMVALARALEQVELLAPDDLEVKLDLGAVHMEMGQIERAIAAFEGILRRQPKHMQALKLVGDMYRKAGDADRAIAVYEKMRRLSPEDPRPYFLLGAAYVEAGHEAKAEQILQAAQEFHRYVGEAWIDLGALALRRGDFSTANWYLQRAVLRAPNRPKARFNYALLLNATNQRSRALGELKLAAELDPQDAEIHYLAGVILIRLGRLDEAKLAFGEALKRSPAHADAKHNLALLLDLDKRYGTERAGVGAR